jgi:hypothetical protein
VLRSGEEVALTLVWPLGRIGEAPTRLTWRLEGPPRACSAEIAQADLTPVWTSPATWDSFIAVPDAIRENLVVSTQYVWRVSCDSGASEEGTPYREFSISPHP